MELLKIAQVFNTYPKSKVQGSELLKEVDLNYSIPNAIPGTQTIRKMWAGYTSLHIAVKRNDLKLINELLERGADLVKQGITDGCTPLHIAAFKKSIFYMSGLLCKCSVIDTLLSRQLKINNTLNSKCKEGVSHLHIACIVNNAKAVEFFAKAKVPLDDCTNSDFYYLPGYTPLHCAIQYSSTKTVNILLRHGADVRIENAKGMSCLHFLIERMMDMTDFIMIGKRTLCKPYEEEIKRLESIVKLVLQARAKTGTFVDNTELSALHVTCTLKDTRVLEVFLKNGLDVNMPVKNDSKFWPGWTPLHFAACFNIEMMILLMHRGANIMIKNSKGETALDLCAKRFTPVDIQLILSKEDQLKDIVLTDNSCTKLADLLIAMNDLDNFSDFLKKLKDINIAIPLNSPIWPGYNLLHLSVSFIDRTKHKKFSDRRFDRRVNPESVLMPYNCTEDEEVLYIKRIELLLEHDCSVSTRNAKGQTPIHLTFSLHRKATVKQLLTHSEENVVDPNGLSHLHIACAVGHLDAVKRYLSQGVDVNSQLTTGFHWEAEHPINVRANSTLLHIAVAFGRDKIVEYLLERKADVYARDSLGLTPIHLIMDTRLTSQSIAKLLFKGTPNLRDSVGPANLSHLHVAAWAGDRETVDKLLLDGAQVDRVIEANVEGCSFLDSRAGYTPLFMARDEAVESLLMAGANVHVKDSNGISVLQHALRHFDETETTYFIQVVEEGKCDVESCGMTELHIACGNCDIEWARKLLNKGADVNARVSDDGSDLNGATPLYVLLDEARIGFDNQHLVDFVEMLIDAGADATIDCRGVTPIHMMYDVLYAWAANDEDFVESEFFRRSGDILLKSLKSYDINPVNSHSFSHFHYACIRNNVEVVTKFLDHEVNVNESVDPLDDRDDEMEDQIGGFTPLHFAVAYESKDVALLLLERGADVNAEDVNGNRPLHVAFKRDFVDLPLIETMFNLGADMRAENLRDESLFYCLSKSDFVDSQTFEFFLNSGCLKNILDMGNVSHEGIMGLAMRSVGPRNFEQILERLMQNDELKNAMQNGFNVLQNTVAIDHKGEIKLDDYLDVIQLLIDHGCDLDHQDTDGITALHAAVRFNNLEAVNALLQLGANINVTDKWNASSFTDMIAVEYDERREMDIVRALASHVWKMRLAGLELAESNLRCLEEVEEQLSLGMWIKNPCQSELKYAKRTEIYEGLTVGDFLSEMGSVAEYPRMGSVRRDIVDKYFKDIVLRYEFLEFFGVLTCQYRKALTRMELWETAKEAILLICRFELPDLCLEAILRYFSNNEMKLVIELTKELI